MAPDLKEYSEDEIAKVRGCTVSPPQGRSEVCLFDDVDVVAFPFLALRGVSSTARSKIAGW
jgi:hypothetical protein